MKLFTIKCVREKLLPCIQEGLKSKRDQSRVRYYLSILHLKTNKEPQWDRNKQDQSVSSYFPCLWLPKHRATPPLPRPCQHLRLYWFSNFFLVTQTFYALGSEYKNRYSCPLYNTSHLKPYIHLTPKNKLRSWHTCPYSQAQHWLPCCCLSLFCPVRLTIQCPRDDPWASGITLPLSISTLGSSSNKGGVSVLVSVISPAFCDHSPSLAPEAQPIT